MLNQPFFQVALPIITTFIVAVWASSHTNNKRLDDIRADNTANFNEVKQRLTRIEERVTDLERKVDGLQIKAWR